MFGRGGFDFLNFIFAAMDAERKEKHREKWGITNVNGYDGVDGKIPHQYMRITTKYNCYYCQHGDKMITVYDYAGNKLFTTNDVDFLGDDYFLVKVIDEEIIPEDWGYALFHKSEQLTEDIYKSLGWLSKEGFNPQGYMVVKLCDEDKVSVVLNKKGEEVYRKQGKYYDSTIKLHGVIAEDEQGFLNLLTHEYICSSPRYSRDKMDNGECLFIKTEDTCIYQISMNNGEFIIHGKPKEKKKPKTNEEVKAEESRLAKNMDIKDKYNQEAEKWSKLNRNDKCLCGSGKKFKYCCMKTYKDDLRKKMNNELEQKGLN